MNPRSEDLLHWYDRHARDLPWRIPPHEAKVGVVPEPYRIWLSEVMLQQTTVATVKEYFLRFTNLWPTLNDLAAASQDDVLREWAGLGYYSRARNLKKCADEISQNFGGIFPENEAELLKLPGIGPYTAAAISTIAFNKPAAVVDGNIERVVSRLFTIDEELPAAKVPIKEKMAEIMSHDRAGDFAQAMMDLGATICTPKRPACALCPWRDDCAAFKAGTQETYPRKAPKKQKPTRYGSAFIITNQDGALLLRKREEKGLLGGMTEVPGSDWTEDQALTTPLPSFSNDWQEVKQKVRHTFTHFHLEVDVFITQYEHPQPPIADAYWCPIEEVPREALPTIMKKIIEAALPGATKKRK